MMLYPPMSVLAEKAGSRYLLVNLVARRARNIAAAAQAAGAAGYQAGVHGDRRGV